MQFGISFGHVALGYFLLYQLDFVLREFYSYWILYWFLADGLFGIIFISVIYLVDGFILLLHGMLIIVIMFRMLLLLFK